MSYDVQKLLDKGKKFYRMSPEQYVADYNRPKSDNSGYEGEGSSKLPKFTVVEVSQDQFMKELMPQSHLIHDTNYRPNTPVTSDGLPHKAVSENEIVDWRQRARVSIPKQMTIAEKQRVHLIGNQFDFDLFKGDSKLFDNFKKYWKAYHIHAGISEVVKSALTTGDGAIYFYIDSDGDIKYDVWSYKYGNNVSHHKAAGSRKECITRYYTHNTDAGNAIEVVEVYDDTHKWVYKRSNEGGATGFTQTDKVAHGFTVIPVAYNKLDDVAWGPAQNLIEQIESSLSDLRESNEYFQFQILFLKGGTVKVLPNASKQGKVIEGDADSDAKTIEPQSKPDSFVLEVDTLTDALNESVGVVDVDTEALKGDTSGAYVKSIYFPATSYALNQMPFWADFFDKCIRIVVQATGKIEKQISDYVDLKVMYDLKPFVPQNEYEQAQILQYLRTAGAISKKTASEVHVFSTPEEYAKIEREEQEAYERSFGAQDLVQGELD